MFVERFEIGAYWIEIDLLRRAAIVDGRPLLLARRELEIFAYLLARRPAIVSRRELLREVCRLRIDPGTNIVAVHISRLRAKLARIERCRLIETVRGKGYRLTGAG